MKLWQCLTATNKPIKKKRTPGLWCLVDTVGVRVLFAYEMYLFHRDCAVRNPLACALGNRALATEIAEKCESRSENKKLGIEKIVNFCFRYKNWVTTLKGKYPPVFRYPLWAIQTP